MKNTIVKVDKNHLFVDIDTILIVWLSADKLINCSGKIALSIKHRKKRVILRGMLEWIPESTPSGLNWKASFKPNNLEKAKTLFPAMQ